MTKCIKCNQDTEVVADSIPLCHEHYNNENLDELGIE